MSKLPPREYTATARHPGGRIHSCEFNRMPEAVDYCRAQFRAGAVTAMIKYQGNVRWAMCRVNPQTVKSGD